MLNFQKFFLILIIISISACSSIPQNTSNSCSIFNERYLWYKHAKSTEKRWGTPIYVQLAIIKMESDFDWLAKPQRNKLATRARFKDSVDFIGWYTDKTESLLKISKKDAFRQYLAYHEGWGGYKNYKNNQKVIGLAKKVKNQSNKYKSQLKKCEKRLNKNKYIIF